MANTQASEQEIQFRKRARRRLVGAVALVLLMITVLPMVLDDQPPSMPQSDIAISIPSQDGDDFTSRIVPVPEGPEAAPEPPAPAAPAHEDTARPAAETPPPAQQAKAPAVPSAPAKGGFAVQIGVYADAANVGKLQDKLAAQGVQTYTENLATAAGPRIRLRMGPYATRAEAEKGLEALKAAGITGMVVTR